MDALIGYSLSGNPRGVTARLIEALNSVAAPVLSLDTPSGVDTASGEVHKPAVRATATMTLALPKVGLRSPAARLVVGELYLADIGVPPGLYHRFGLSVAPIFRSGEVLRVR